MRSPRILIAAAALIVMVATGCQSDVAGPSVPAKPKAAAWNSTQAAANAMKPPVDTTVIVNKKPSRYAMAAN
jgi:hypothetical protein